MENSVNDIDLSGGEKSAEEGGPGYEALQHEAAALAAEPKPKSGTTDRLYYIFEMTSAEVDGHIIEVPVRRTFPGEGGAIIEGIVARNRDLAISRAARFFGAGWSGVLVATPESMWQPREVENVPSDGFSPRVGGVS